MDLPAGFEFNQDEHNELQHLSGVLSIRVEPLLVQLRSNWADVLSPTDLSAALVAYAGVQQGVGRRSAGQRPAPAEITPSRVSPGQALAIMEELRRIRADADERLEQAKQQNAAAEPRPVVEEVTDDDGCVTAVLVGSSLSAVELPATAASMASSVLAMRLTNVLDKVLNPSQRVSVAPEAGSSENLTRLEAIRHEVGLHRTQE